MPFYYILLFSIASVIYCNTVMVWMFGGRK